MLFSHYSGSERIDRQLNVLKNADGLCFNQDTTFNQRVASHGNRKLTCPIEKNFGNPNALRDLQWYKVCSHRLHEDEKYHFYDKYLVIRNTTKDDEGMYLCQAQFAYMEKQYNVSRSINLNVFVQCLVPPNITYPRNHSVEADLGSSVLMDCNVSTCTDLVIYWTVNGKPLQDFSSMYEAVQYKSYLNVDMERDQPKKWIMGSKFNISKVKSEDYLEFTCVVQPLNSLSFQSSAYIVLNRPARNIQGYLIGGLAAPLFVILASVLIYKFFKVDIVLWYRDSCQLFLRKEVLDGKLYDAYVLYPKNATNCSYSSDIFVLKVLPDVLEKQCGYKLFIFGRDDLPGQVAVGFTCGCRAYCDSHLAQQFHQLRNKRSAENWVQLCEPGMTVSSAPARHSVERWGGQKKEARSQTVETALALPFYICMRLLSPCWLPPPPPPPHLPELFREAAGPEREGEVPSTHLPFGLLKHGWAQAEEAVGRPEVKHEGHIMGVLYCFGLILLFAQNSCQLVTEKCNVPDDEVENEGVQYVIVGQPLAFPCTLREILHLEETNSSLTWYKSGTETPITKNVHSRIHQNANVLWFLPATFQDAGFYECIVRYWHQTRCYKSVVRVSIYNTSAGLCFDELHYFQEVPLGINANIVCPEMYYFREQMADLLIQWFKGCEPLTREGITSDYIIKNVNEKDAGDYQCNATFIYAGKKYTVSRSISVTTIKVPVKKVTEILYPRNNTIEAELGSNVFVECNVSSFKGNILAITWKVNKTPVNSLHDSRIHEGFQINYPVEENQFSTVPLNITPLKSEDYGTLFLCQAGEAAAYISIQRPPLPVVAYVMGGLAAFTVIIFVPVLIYVLFKIEIVLWYRKSCRPFLHKRVSDGKIYDAYVLYPKNCNPNGFVLNVLPEVLEKQCGYNLFIFGRDDLPGKAVVSLIDETVKQSRRLIIILVPELPSYSLLEDAPEQEIAVYSALIRDGMKVILIEMEKIKDYSNMPESIQYIKQKHGAVRWKGDLKERRSYSANTTFWKKVRYQMPPAQLRSSELPLVPTALNTCPAIET
ncbi:hypothetical protein lerEdw1_016594 [Lerista edwardsae]|nr:hypothetical protein lerEdw1_016594 [Lerista edwardsae]